MQMVIYEVARDGFLDKHIEVIREVYKQRRDVMVAAMQQHFPPEVTWTIPEGGLFLMVRMPEHIDALELLEAALEYKVAFVPGAV
jgi:2-aminoadipate transaminase